MCPFCHRSDHHIKNGIYTLRTTNKKIQRFICLSCHKGFSTQTLSFDYRLRKRKINQTIFRMMAKGNSQRGCAQILGITPRTVARRVIKFGRVSKIKLDLERKSGAKYDEIMVDEMESFEHTKLKPVTIPIAVEKKSRKILALDVGRIAAKGHLSKKSLAKYGYRICERKKVLTSFFKEIRDYFGDKAKIISDESPHYVRHIANSLRGIPHIRYKGGRGSIVGQGELKKKAFDPLFQLNHTYAMVRDNIKRLSRRTWCTTKKIDRLKGMLYLYANYHNQIIDGIFRPIIGNPPN